MSTEENIEIHMTTGNEQNLETYTYNKDERRIVSALLRFGVNPKLKGYIFIKDSVSIILSADNCGRSLNLSREIYPEVARMHNTNVADVERNIRFAVSSAINALAVNSLVSVVGKGSASLLMRHKTTSKNFIKVISEYVRFN